MVGTIGLVLALLLCGVVLVSGDTIHAFKQVAFYGTLYNYNRKFVYILVFISVYVLYKQRQGFFRESVGLSATWAFAASLLGLTLPLGAQLVFPGVIGPTLLQIFYWALTIALVAGCGLVGAVCAREILTGNVRSLHKIPHIVATAILAQIIFTSAAFQSYMQGAAIGLTLKISSALYQMLFGVSLHIVQFRGAGSPMVIANGFTTMIAPSCSGLVGVLIACLGLAGYIGLNHLRLNLFRATIAAGIGVVAVFLANSLRIALLMRIGAMGHGDIAVAGFHSHFGTLSLLLIVAAVLVMLQSAPFRRLANANLPVVVLPPQSDVYLGFRQANVVALVPLALYLFAGMVLGLWSAGFDWLYPVHALLGLVILAAMQRRFGLLSRMRFGFVDMLVGIAVFAIWIALVPEDREASRRMGEVLGSIAPRWAMAWIVVRGLASSLMIPVLEELAFRSGLQEALTRQLSTVVPVAVASAISIAVAAVVFAGLHSNFLAAAIAGLAYGALFLRTRSVGSPILAHAVTNFLIAVYAMVFEKWSYW